MTTTPPTASSAPARKERITVVGAGPVGSLLGILLAQRGYQVTVFERRPDPRSGKLVGGRSINLALSDRGLLALERAGIRDDVEKVAIPMRGRTLHPAPGPDGSVGALAFQPYGTGDQAIRSVSRGGLNVALIELLRAQKNVRVVFDRKCIGGDVHKPSVLVESPTGERAELESDIVIGTDGAFSAVRGELQRLDRFNYSQTYLEHGYKELTIPGGKDGAFLLEKNALHIWPRADFMLIALPNTDGSFTCTLFFRHDRLRDDDDACFAALSDAKTARAFFARVFPDALALMPTFERDWTENPTSSLATFRAFPWSVPGKTLLVGDAAHGIVPFFGQGMNAGFEDCRALIDVLDQEQDDAGRDDWTKAMRRFERERKPNTDAIAELALENFVEMRDKVADPRFLLRKKIEARLATLCPDKLVPAYTMVTFSPHLPYAEALARIKRQEAVLDEACALPNIEASFASGARDDELKRIVQSKL